MFSKVLGVVLSFLGISAFAKDENGKSILLDVQREQLKQKYGELFLQSFEKELQEFEKDGASAESAVTPEVVASLESERDEYARLLAESRARLKKLVASSSAALALTASSARMAAYAVLPLAKNPSNAISSSTQKVLTPSLQNALALSIQSVLKTSQSA